MKFQVLQGSFILMIAYHTATTEGQHESAFMFSTCEQKVRSLLNGTYSEGSINNETIWEQGYIYTGPVSHLKPSYPRSEYLALTLDGCRVLCGHGIGLAEPTSALALTATWVFPLAILLNLPYESHHNRKVRRTLASATNWLGSPQSALTATLWNFRHIRWCHRRSREDNLSRELSDAYYVLSCMNQFDLGENPSDQFFQALVYGLFRPIAQIDNGQPPFDISLTRQLLANIAFQLRMLRRRAVIPTLASLGTFLVAFVFSVVLAFGDLGDHTSVLSLSLGLLVLWLPLLVIFTIVDRNPISSQRSAELMSRWLYSVNAVREWAMPRLDPDIQTVGNINWWTPAARNQYLFPIGDFIGQGRKMQYSGLVHAVMSYTESDAGIENLFRNDIRAYDECASKISQRVQGYKPFSWYVTAAVSFLLVWVEIMMAVMFAFNTPTIGPGCWSGSCFIFGVLSSVGWVAQFKKRPGPWIIGLAHAFNFLALLWLVAVIIFQITGTFNNCWCLSAPIAYPTFGGYIGFGSSLDFRDNFNVLGYWASAAAIGGLVPVAAFVTAVFWWLKCQHLWSANERHSRGFQLEPVQANLNWLQ